ncbi:AAA family ATPase [Candidatus Hodgkinia cicadicola]
MPFKLTELPDARISIKRAFAIDVSAHVPAFATRTKFKSKHLPKYQFDKKTTLCVLAGLVYNKRVLISGAYGAGKSSHIEQTCNRLNWPYIRINMDSCLTRLELIGKDIITVKNGLYAIKFKYGIVPWAARRGIALVLDDYDACKLETKYVLNKLLEANGEISIPENNKVVTPHANFRVFATCNKIKSKQHESQNSNLAQLDRWNIVALMSYPDQPTEYKLVLKSVGGILTNTDVIQRVSQVSNAIRRLYSQGTIRMPLSIRGVLSWIELSVIFNSVNEAFKCVYLNKCTNKEINTVLKYYNQAFGIKC